MSLFLGKIHYWLYDKILWFESLENQIVKWASENKLPIDQWLKEMGEQFGEPSGGKPLEDIIDTSNIHGWLQGKISVAEGRQAYLVTQIVKTNLAYKNDLKQIFIDLGKQASKDYMDEALENPEQVYNALNDYILEGMPCDRVNEVEESNDSLIQWKRTTCLHQKYWDAINGNVADFYELRGAWVESFVHALEGNFKYEKVSEDSQKIFR